MKSGKKLSRLTKVKRDIGCGGSPLVEARGIEPLSEKHLQRFSPSAVCHLRFPRRNADKQALRFGRLRVMTEAEPNSCSRSPLIDAHFRPWSSGNERLPN